MTYLIPNQLLQEVEKPGTTEDEETEMSKSREEEDHDDEGKTESHLDKYMKIILEAQQTKQTEVSFSNVCETLSFFCV